MKWSNIRQPIAEIIALYPAVFALIVLIVGVLMGIYIGFTHIVCISIFILVFVCILLIIKAKRFQLNELFSTCVLLIIYVLGIFRGYYSVETPKFIPSNCTQIDLRVNDIKDGNNSMRIAGTVLSAYDSIGVKLEYDIVQDVLITIQGIDYSLVPGVIIRIPNKFSLVDNLRNPDEFDYKTYLNRQGIFFQAYINSKNYEIVSISPTISNRINSLKMSLNKLILTSKLSSDSKYFLSAILLGDKHNLNVETRNLFSNIGISHVLALSGLHVGIISLLVYFLLFPLDYIIDRRIRVFLSIALLIMYAILTGLSVSVVRATLLSSVCAIGFCLRRKISPINLLAFVAFVMIVINPQWIYDIGFQLSFLAVLFILIFAHKINPINRKKVILYNIMSLISVTISASMGTFMLSAYYFHVIPVMFLIPNLILIPILPILLFIGILAVITNFHPIVYVYDLLYDILIKLFSCINNLDFSFIDNVEILPHDIVMYMTTTSIIAIILYNTRLWKKLLPTIVFILVLWVGISFTASPSVNGILIMNHYRETPIIIYDKKIAHLLLPADSIGAEFINEFKQYHKSYLSRRHIKELRQSESPLIIDSFGAKYFDYNTKHFILIDGKLTKDTLEISERVRCDYLLITKNYYASMNRVLSKYKPDTIIISGNIYSLRRKKLISQIESFGLPYYDIKEEGAFMLENN